MGEIRERIRLTNALDEELYFERKITRDQVRSVEVDAIVDTGAVRSVIPLQVMQQLGVTPRGDRIAKYADGRSEAVPVTRGIIFECQGRDTLEEALVLGEDVLLGQTVLEKLDLLADCRDQKLVPHPGRPNQPVSMVR